jgi:hypothetical protein
MPREDQRLPDKSFRHNEATVQARPLLRIRCAESESAVKTSANPPVRNIRLTCPPLLLFPQAASGHQCRKCARSRARKDLAEHFRSTGAARAGALPPQRSPQGTGGSGIVSTLVLRDAFVQSAHRVSARLARFPARGSGYAMFCGLPPLDEACRQTGWGLPVVSQQENPLTARCRELLLEQFWSRTSKPEDFGNMRARHPELLDGWPFGLMDVIEHESDPSPDRDFRTCISSHPKSLPNY